jgi:arylsulfatase A-like enzyme
MNWISIPRALAVCGAVLALSGTGQAQENQKPNILVIWGDDIGTWNISHNNRGMMGYETPNIDRIANEGVAFTDYYAQQSCTAGRAAFIGGNVPVRTGMTKVGLPGAEQGWQKTDVTMATVLKSQGYATGQFGKNHQGDLDEHLPDHARLRRVLWQSLSPQCRGRAGKPRLSARHGSSPTARPSRTVRPARRHPFLGQSGRDTEHRRHRPAHQEAHGNRG